MRSFVKADYYIQLFLAFVLNPIGVCTLYGMLLSFPIIGLYQLVSDVLYVYVFKVDYLQKKRKIHLFTGIAYVIVLPLVTYFLYTLNSQNPFPETLQAIFAGLAVLFYLVIPEVMVWVRLYWSRKQYLFETKQIGKEDTILRELHHS